MRYFKRWLSFVCTLLFLSLLSLARHIFSEVLSISSSLTCNEFGVEHWLSPLSEAAEGGGTLVPPSSGFCSKCTLLFDVTLLLGRLLSLLGWEERGGFVLLPWSGLKVTRGLPVQSKQHQAVLYQGSSVLLRYPFLPFCSGILCFVLCSAYGFNLTFPLSTLLLNITKRLCLPWPRMSCKLVAEVLAVPKETTALGVDWLRGKICWENDCSCKFSPVFDLWVVSVVSCFPTYVTLYFLL